MKLIQIFYTIILVKQKGEKPYQEQFWTKYMQTENIDFQCYLQKKYKTKG